MENADELKNEALENDESEDELDNSKDEILALAQKINTEKPNPKDVAKLRQALRDSAELWLEAHNLNRKVRRLALASFDNAAKEQILLQVESLQNSLAPWRHSHFQHMLIEQVGTTWLHLTLAQMFYSSALKHTANPQWLGWIDRRLTAAQRRYYEAVNTLARLKRWSL